MVNFEKIYFPRSKKKIVLKSRRPVSIFLALLSLLAIVTFVAWMVLPEFIAAVILLLETLPDTIQNAIDWAQKAHFLPPQLLEYLDGVNWDSVFDSLIDVVKNYGGDAVNFIISTVSSMVSWIITIFLSVIFAVYILANKETLSSQSHRIMCRFLNEKLCTKVEYLFRVLSDCFRRYIVGQSVEAVILGTLCALGMLILGLPYPTMIGALVAFTALIPVAGAYIGGAVGAIMILTVSPVKALIFVIFLIILQQLEGNLIYPRVVGTSLGLPGIWVLAAVTIGGGVGGILGMLLGVPLAAALYRLMRHNMRKYALEQAEKESSADSPAEPPSTPEG
jgi:predicted PurR-regulated permease PerM